MPVNSLGRETVAGIENRELEVAGVVEYVACSAEIVEGTGSQGLGWFGELLVRSRDPLELGSG